MRSEPTLLTDAQRLDWLRLIRSENVGPGTFRWLLNRYGGARAALDALPDLARRGGAKRSGRICSKDDAQSEIERSAKLGVRFAAMGEPSYPPRLRMIDDAPPLLAIRGHAAMLAMPMIAIVGSRNASAAGLKFAQRLAHDLQESGLIVISGLARGIDAAAHRATLAGGTVAVLAGGHDQVYPPEHIPLLDDIVKTGAAISEMPLGWQPRAQEFPRRNRLISGCALGVVIVEAARRSGSLITARMANEQGREVFAVPGSPIDPRAEGTNGLLKQGATLVTEAEDVLSVVRPILGHAADMPVAEPSSEMENAADPGDDVRARIMSLLSPAPIDIDDLIRLSGVAAPAVRMVLLELDLAGRLERSFGGRIAMRSG